VRRRHPIISANLRWKPPLIARRAVHHCAPLHIGSVSTLTADILHTQIQFATLRVDNGRSASWGTGVDSADRGAWTLPTSSDLELMFAAPSRA
jgi:hypothetical protein